MSILIKNGHIITVSTEQDADIYIEGEKIIAIGKDLNYKADRIIDAEGLYVFPGGIDPHTHLDMPFMGTYSNDNFETGTRAALHGGTTTVIDFIMQPKGTSLKEALAIWQEKAKIAVGDYSFHMAVTEYHQAIEDELIHMIEEEGISSFKVFMAYKGSIMLNDESIIKLMNRLKELGGTVSAHATNGAMIDDLVTKFVSEKRSEPIYHYLSQPEITESEASSRFIDMLEFTGCTGYIVHLTCEGALNAVRRATKRNQKINVETCTQYLTLDASLYERPDGAKWVMSPPLREKKDQKALWAGINQGLIHTLASDHCPFCLDQKDMGKDDFSKIPNGMPGLEPRFEIFFSEGVAKGKVNLSKFVALTSTNAAKIFGMYPQKGTIAIGSDADLVLFDPNKKHIISAESHHMNCDYSGWEGLEVTGKCETVILRGKVAIENGECKLEAGNGQFIARTKASGLE